MLHRSFKPAKCKTALKLAVSRIKLLKNKRAAHMLQLRREVAQLLESGQERTARIRVEHVIREEKTMAAYDLLEVYLELIVARLAMIESQKNCPIDLKEAVTSIIFASPRCADLPELQDIRKQFQSKYGKEFSTAALELRPGCGVSRLMIEKLSVGAPDIQTKSKILSAIASEHNVKWDPETSGENEERPSEDLLNRPKTFLRASQSHEEPPVQAPAVDTQRHDAYLYDNQSSPSISQNIRYAATPSTSQSQLGTPNVRAEGMEHGYTYSGDQKTFAAGKQNWNMEFTDATSAAQAAAEAAERASMAARAAAELSSGERVFRQQQSESQRSLVSDLRNARIDKHAVPTISNANVTQDPAEKLEHGGDKISTQNYQQPHLRPDAAHQNEGHGDGTFSGKSNMPPDPVFGNDGKGRNSKLDSSLGSNRFSTESKRDSHDSLRAQGTNANEEGNQIRVNEQLNQPVHIRKSSRSDSLKSKASSHEDELFFNTYSRENIFSSSDQVVEHENIFAGEAGFDIGSSNQKSTETEHINYSGDENLYEQSNSGTFRSHSTKFNGDHDDLERDELHAHGTETAVFDNSDSDDDVLRTVDFTGGFKYDYPDPFSSPDPRSPIYESPKRSSWFASGTSYDDLVSKPTNNESSKLFGDQSDIVGSSPSHESLPVTFDQSDSDDEADRSNNVMSTNESRHTDFSAGSSTCECVTTFPKFDEDEPQHHISSHSVVSDKDSKLIRESPNMRRDETGTEQTSLDTGKELNLGLLSGGLRNKGKKNPFYIKSPTDAPSLPSVEIHMKDPLLSPTRTFAVFESSAKQRPGGLQQSKRTDKKSVMHYHLDEDSSHSEDELPPISFKHSQNASSVSSHKSSFNSRTTYSDSDKLSKEGGTSVQSSRSKLNIGSSSVDSPKSNVSSRATYADNDDLLNEKETTVPVSRPKPNLGSGLSRRTKTSTPDGQRNPSKETFGTASLSVIETQTGDQAEQSEAPKLTRPVPRKSALEVKRRPNKPSSSNEKLEYSSNVSPKPSIAASSSTPKTDQTATRQDSIKKASHVHPKLPDFDTLAAHFSSLRTDSK